MATSYSSGKKTDVIHPREELPDGHPSAETRDLHSRDCRLRNHGFEIYSWPRHGPNRWGIGRYIDGTPILIVSESEAHLVCAEWDKRVEKETLSVFDIAAERRKA